MFDEIVSDIMKGYIHRLADSGKRIDGRALDEYRNIEIARGIISSAEGSAQVNLGDTSVLVGIKIEPGEPFPDMPAKGVLTTNAELIPMASPSFESGPPGEDAIELARVVDRGIRESEAIDLNKLCIVPKEKVWVVFIDIHVLDYDGNLFDASALGAICALANTKVPASRFELSEDFPLPLNHYPVACTAVKIEDMLLIDPILDEERIANARLTVATDENGDIRAMQKGLSGAFTYEEVVKVIKMSQELGRRFRNKIVEV